MTDYMYGAVEGSSNPSPIDCADCKGRVLARGAKKFLMNTEDLTDFDWLCPPCWNRRWESQYD